MLVAIRGDQPVETVERISSKTSAVSGHDGIVAVQRDRVVVVRVRFLGEIPNRKFKFEECVE